MEMVDILNVSDVLLCFRRFSVRRRVPRSIVSDNARMFVGVNLFLRKLIVSEEAQEYFGNHNVEWRFNLSRVP